jgi:hypothetical protein
MLTVRQQDPLSALDLWQHEAMPNAPDPAGPLKLLVGRDVSAVCFVRDYVELHFDGPVLRAIADPFGVYGCRGWRFPDGRRRL